MSMLIEELSEDQLEYDGEALIKIDRCPVEDVLYPIEYIDEIVRGLEV